MNRRTFARTLAVTALSYRRILGANDRLGMALIGAGRRGREVMQAFLTTGQVDLRCICDLYDVQRDRARQMLVKGAEKPYECATHEFALAASGVDAVLIGTPDHWHLDIALDSFRQRKHVYLEKPAVHQFAEGPVLLKAARTSGRVCSVGTQQRSGAHYRQARDQYILAGKLGKVVMVRTAWSNFPWQARRIAPQAKPAGLDWLRFLGKTPYFEYDHARYDSWRYFPEYGGGVLADILNHWSDVAQWLMDDAQPIDCVASGGIYQLNDGRVNPDTVHAIVRYRKGWSLSFESTVLPVRDERPGVTFVGTEGTLEITRAEFVFRPNQGEPVTVKAEGDLNVAHCRDFVQAVRQGSQPAADVAVGLQGLLPCLMARAAYWSGQRVRYDAARNEIM
jgi:predicted dehydrogenase